MTEMIKTMTRVLMCSMCVFALALGPSMASHDDDDDDDDGGSADDTAVSTFRYDYPRLAGPAHRIADDF